MYEELRKRIPVCEHAPEDPISADLLGVLTDLETELDAELEYNSGYRCEECNKEASGSKNSAHLRGLAVDVRGDTSRLRYNILRDAMLLEFKRVGIGKRFIHLDVDESLDQEVMWLYD